MSTANKLTYLNTTKQKIKEGLNNLGADLTENDTFRSYANVLSDMYDELPKVTAEGTDLELSNTKKGKLVITPKGNSSQFSTTGKNLLPNNATSQAPYGVTVTKNSDGSVTLDGTSTNPFNIVLTTDLSVNAGQYTMSLRNRINGVGIYAYVGGTLTQVVSATADASTIKTTFTLNENTTFNEIRLYIPSSRSFSNLTVYPQIETGTSATSYEPFTNGIPAPNPSYPYPVKVVTGENSIKIQNKNLININLLFGNTTYYSINSDKEVTLTTADTRNFNSLDGTTWGMYLEAGTYTISYNPNSHGSLQVSQKDVGTIITNVALSAGKASFTLTQSGIIGVKFIGLTGYLPYTPGHIQIEKGSTATEYVEHREQLSYSISLGNMELCKVGAYQDYIYGNPNHWYKKQVIGKIVLDGSETWTLGGASSDEYYVFQKNASIDNDKSTSALVCNNFTNMGFIDGGTYYSQDGIGLNAYSKNLLRVWIKGTNLSEKTSSAFRNWLSTHNTIVYYPLETPQDVQITDETLISQLNNIYNNAYSYNGVTNITSTYADGNAQMIIDASALKSWEVTE